MTEKYDAIVIGLGAMGSAALYQLSNEHACMEKANWILVCFL